MFIASAPDVKVFYFIREINKLTGATNDYRQLLTLWEAPGLLVKAEDSV